MALLHLLVAKMLALGGYFVGLSKNESSQFPPIVCCVNIFINIYYFLITTTKNNNFLINEGHRINKISV